jgi:hypothetical protein
LALIAGIDEAGLGPVLGPMVVSAAAFEAPDEVAQTSLWRVLSPAVSRKPTKRGLVAFADSKKLYSGLRGKHGLLHLERGVLAMLAASGRVPTSLAQLLDLVAPECPAARLACPWYNHQEPSLPASVDAMDLRLAANSLATRMVRTSVKLVDLHSQVVLESEYNRLVAATRNKSAMILGVTFRLLHRIWQVGDEHERLYIHVDRQGGRMHYLPAIQRTFEGCPARVVEESERLSVYEITDGRRVARLSFQVGCEEQQLPVALASMLSKYLRELFMGVYNRFWINHLPQLEPTAGYYTDGRRFYQDILPVAQRLGYQEQMLYRQR